MLSIRVGFAYAKSNRRNHRSQPEIQSKPLLILCIAPTLEATPFNEGAKTYLQLHLHTQSLITRLSSLLSDREILVQSLSCVRAIDKSMVFIV